MAKSLWHSYSFPKVLVHHKLSDWLYFLLKMLDLSAFGECPYSHLLIIRCTSENQNTIVEEIKKLSLNELPERDVALEYFVVDQIPMTPNSKADFAALEKLAEEKINEEKKL